MSMVAPQVRKHRAADALFRLVHTGLATIPDSRPAASIPPDQRAVMPLLPAPMLHRDGTDTHEGARHAATRWVAQLRQDSPPLTGRVTAESLRSPAPPIEPRPHAVLHALLEVQEGAHASWFHQGQVAAHPGRVS